jgi:hypothetical protein
VAAKQRRLRNGRPSLERAEPGEELAGGERLRQVVVGAEAEATNPVPDLSGGGQHQDPGRPVPLDQLDAHLVAMDRGQIAVKDHRVVVHDGRLVERGAAVVREIDGHSFAAEPPRYDLGEVCFIFYDQDAHAAPLVRSTVVPTCKRLSRAAHRAPGA